MESIIMCLILKTNGVLFSQYDTTRQYIYILVDISLQCRHNGNERVKMLGLKRVEQIENVFPNLILDSAVCPALSGWVCSCSLEVLRCL